MQSTQSLQLQTDKFFFIQLLPPLFLKIPMNRNTYSQQFNILAGTGNFCHFYKSVMLWSRIDVSSWKYTKPSRHATWAQQDRPAKIGIWIFHFKKITFAGPRTHVINGNIGSSSLTTIEKFRSELSLPRFPFTLVISPSIILGFYDFVLNK